jgi:hypothetical protein
MKTGLRAGFFIPATSVEYHFGMSGRKKTGPQAGFNEAMLITSKQPEQQQRQQRQQQPKRPKQQPKQPKQRRQQQPERPERR